jgi:hypothetical protein
MNEIVPFADMQQMALVMSKNRMFGKSADDLLPLMLIAQAEGLHPAIAAIEYDIINGRPAITSRAALARFQSAGGKIEWKERTDTKASATFSHPQGGSLTIVWTMERAALAGLTGKPNWQKMPAQMLSARVVAEGVRAVYPACLSRLYTDDEVRDFDPVTAPRNVTELREETPAPQPTAPSQPIAEVSDVSDNASPIRERMAAACENLAEIMKSEYHGTPVFEDGEKDLARLKKNKTEPGESGKPAITEANVAYLESVVSEYARKREAIIRRMDRGAAEDVTAAADQAFKDDVPTTEPQQYDIF